MLPKDGRMHFSNLKKYAQSPAHYAMSCTSDGEDSTAFRIGRAVHAAILEGIDPTVYRGGIRKGAKWEAFLAEYPHLSEADILNESEYEIVAGSLASVLENEEAMRVLSLCKEREKEKHWERDGLPCSGRIDAYGPLTLCEIKTGAVVTPRKFLYDAHKYGYHAQMAWYDVALGTVVTPQTKWRDQYIIAIETKAPYTSIVYQLDPLRIDQGNDLIEEWLAKHHACEAEKVWPSFEFEQPITWDAEIIISEDEDED